MIRLYTQGLDGPRPLFMWTVKVYSSRPWVGRVFWDGTTWLNAAEMELDLLDAN